MDDSTRNSIGNTINKIKSFCSKQTWREFFFKLKYARKKSVQFSKICWRLEKNQEDRVKNLNLQNDVVKRIYDKDKRNINEAAVLQKLFFLWKTLLFHYNSCFWVGICAALCVMKDKSLKQNNTEKNLSLVYLNPCEDMKKW